MTVLLFIAVTAVLPFNVSPANSYNSSSIIGLSEQVDISGTTSSAPCLNNEWDCHGLCIHRRMACFSNIKNVRHFPDPKIQPHDSCLRWNSFLLFQSKLRCHADFPNLCGDKKRCFSHADNCWDKACLHVDCLQKSLSLPRDIQGNR